MCIQQLFLGSHCQQQLDTKVLCHTDSCLYVFLQTGTVLGKLAECIGDVDKGVRAALKDLLSKAVLPQLQGPLLGPFLPLVMAHLFSALTSMTEAVRYALFHWSHQSTHHT